MSAYPFPAEGLAADGVHLRELAVENVRVLAPALRDPAGGPEAGPPQASVPVLERAGLGREGVKRSGVPYAGGRADAYLYSLLEGE